MKAIPFLMSGLLALAAMPTSHAAAFPDPAASRQAQALGLTGIQSQGVHNPLPGAQWFPDAGLGLFIHWGLASVHASGDLSWGMLANKPWKDQTVTPNHYYAAANDWHPDKMDYDRMLSAAKAAGFTYAVMVTKHHDGFTLWPSSYGDLGTKYQFQGRDFVKEFVDACRKYGLRVGLYYSPPDWWFDRKYKNFSMKGPPLDMDHKPTELPVKPKDHDEKRKRLVAGQVTELLTRYGKIDLIWFDGGHGEIPNAEVRRLQPGIVINRRNKNTGDYGDSEVNLPDKRFQGWFETCATCWPSRKWSYTEEYGFDDAPTVLTKLVLLRAWGGNLLANVGPKGDGSVPRQALATWNDMTNWMEHSRESVIGAHAGPWPEQVNLPVTTRNHTAYIHFLPKFPDTAKAVLRPLPDYAEEAVWKNAGKPNKAILLRTRQEIPFRYRDGTLTISIPANLRTKSVDVVKLELP